MKSHLLPNVWHSARGQLLPEVIARISHCATGKTERDIFTAFFCLFHSSICGSDCVCLKLFRKWGEKGHTLPLFLSCSVFVAATYRFNTENLIAYGLPWEKTGRGWRGNPAIVDRLPLLRRLLALNKQCTLQPFNPRGVVLPVGYSCIEDGLSCPAFQT